MSARHTLRYRLIAAFSLVVLAFSATVAFVFDALGRTQDAMMEVTHREEAVRYGLTLASCGRDQYIHTAHLLITHEEAHIEEVRQVVEKMGNCQEHVRMAVEGPEETAALEDLDAAAEEFRRVFFEGIVPAVREHRAGDALELHERSEDLLSRIIADNDRLSASFRRKIDLASERAHALAHRALIVTLAAVLISIGSAAAVGLLLGRSILGPVHDLLEGTEAVARGERTLSIPPTSIRELDTLRVSFERMTLRLGQREQELLEAEKKASLGFLAAGVAHQINNPIGVILGYARLLQEGKVPDQKAAYGVIHDEATEAKMIVETLLALARPGRISLVEIEARDLLEETVARVQRYRQAGSRIVVEPVVEGLRLRTDAKKLQQALINLIVNGLEAMPSEGTLGVRAARRDDGVVFEVADEGKGLSTEEMSRLFDPYFTTKKTGTGLGLAITNEVVKALGGRVEVRARQPRGSIFSVVVPVSGEAQG